MELFKNTNYDFLGKKWPFIIASLVLTVAGLTSIAMKGGLKYGIDFKGGALMTVKFAYDPPLEKIRAAMKNSSRSRAMSACRISAADRPERSRDRHRTGQEETPVEHQPPGDGTGPERPLSGSPDSGKLDLNNTSQQALADRLRDPLARAGVAMSEQQLQNLVTRSVGLRQPEPLRPDHGFQPIGLRSGHELCYYEHSSAGVLSGAVPRS